MARAAIEDPLKVFRFKVIVDGFTRMGMTEVSGLKSTTEDVKYREGGGNDTSQKSAGMTEQGDLTFRRGQIVGSTAGGDGDFADWYAQVFDVAASGNAVNYRKDFNIQQMRSSNVIAVVWEVYEAWPKERIPMSDLKADQNDNSFEALTIVNEGWKQVR